MPGTGSNQFDVVVIGSGPGGYKAAVTAAHLGARVALVERALAGGTCLNEGCVPKKTLIYIAGLLEDIQTLNGRGLVGTVEGDFEAARAHKNRVVSEIRQNVPRWMQRLGIRMYTGTASLAGPEEVVVAPAEDADQPLRLSARRIIIATGARPSPHPICQFDGHRIISSSHFMHGKGPLPRSVLCVGGGAIGVELAYLLHQFGTRVCVVEQSERLLNRAYIPERASRALELKFKRIGIDLRKNATVSRCAITAETVEVEFTDGGHGVYDQVLVAIGRQPYTEGLGLENVGVAIDEHGFVVTDDYLQSSVSGIYAIGDVKAGPMTANAALHDAKVAASNAIAGNHVRRNYNRVPVVIDSALEIAAVGLSEERAEDAGFEPDVARSNFGGSAKARGRADYEGFIEVVHDEETGQLLGGCIVGPESGEQIQMLTAACQSPKGLWFLKDISYSHPSWCEELENAVDPYTSEVVLSGKEVFRPGIYAIHD